jgi:hypothetical protein
MLASIACHLLLYLIWACASLAMRRPHSDGTGHLLGMFTFYTLYPATICSHTYGCLCACGLARECCPCFNGAPLVVLIRPLLPYIFWVCMSLTLRRPHCLLRFQQWFPCENGNKIRKASTSRPIWQQIDWRIHHTQAKVRKALFDCFRPPLVLFPRQCCRFVIAVQSCLGSGGPGTWTQSSKAKFQQGVGATSLEPRSIMLHRCASLLPRFTMCCPHSFLVAMCSKCSDVSRL